MVSSAITVRCHIYYEGDGYQADGLNPAHTDLACPCVEATPGECGSRGPSLAQRKVAQCVDIPNDREWEGSKGKVSRKRILAQYKEFKLTVECMISKEQPLAKGISLGTWIPNDREREGSHGKAARKRNQVQ